MTVHESYKKIVKWLERERFVLTRQKMENYDFYVRVETTPDSFIPFYIYSHSDSPEKVVVCWDWKLMDSYVESLRQTNDEIKRALYRDLQAVTFLKNTNMKFKPDIQKANLKDELRDLNLQEVQAIQSIYQDGLTRDRLINTVQQIIYTFGYIMHLFEKYGLSHPQRDPTKLA
ncbi:MAG: DUF2299 family protein [Nitrososphaeraceae archaeon]